MILFLDYDGVVNNVIRGYDNELNKLCANYSHPHLGKVNDYQAVQWISELCEKYNIDIVVTSTWRLCDNYKMCLVAGGLRKGIKILGRVTRNNNLTRAEQINQYLMTHPEIGDQFIIIDDDDIDMSPFGYNNDEHFVKCTTNGGFQLEEFDEAERKVKRLKKEMKVNE